MEYHKTVLLHETVEALNIESSGVYVDLTFGGGGHSKEVLSKLDNNGKLIAFDQDENALLNTVDDSRFQLIRQNFETAYEYLIALGIQEIDGVMADLGVSSFQLNDDESGFSYRPNIDLDMRMDKSRDLKAKDILNGYSEDTLQMVFQNYGEVRNAKTLTKRIVAKRSEKKFDISNDLNEILEELKFGTFPSYAAPIYQALRMEVNRELQALEKMLISVTQLIKSGGRLAIITFHSLEDRIVKNFMKYGEFTNQPETDVFGRRRSWNWKLITKKPITPTDAELKENPRSRSAKLRVLEKN